MFFHRDRLDPIHEIRIMSEGGYKIINKKEVHFVTFAVVEWLDACLPAGRYSQEKNIGTSV